MTYIRPEGILNGDVSNATSNNEVTVAVNTATPGGTIKPTTLDYGNFQILQNLGAKDRKFLRTYGGNFVSSDGKVYKITPGTSRQALRDFYLREKRAKKANRKMQELGISSQVSWDNPQAQEIYEAGINNPEAEYVSYQKKEQTPVVPTPSDKKYTYSFDTSNWEGDNPSIDSGIGKATIDLIKVIGTPEWLNAYAKNGVVNNKSISDWLRAENIDGFNGALTDKIINSIVSSGKYPQINQEWADNHKLTKVVSNRKGGKMLKFQMGGAVNQAQVAQEEATQQQNQLTEIFQAIAAKPKETLALLQQQGIQPKQIIELAQKMADTNPAAKEALAALQKMSQMAKQGTKLQYIKRLRGECPKGFEMKMFKAGGQLCKKCMKIQDAKSGKKLKKGDESATISKFKEMRCGGKAKKKC